MMYNTGSKLLFHIAIAASFLAVIFQVTPVEKSWMKPADIKKLEHPLPRIGSGENYLLQEFSGGDGLTRLVGRLHLPETSPMDQHLEEEDAPRPPIIVMAHGLGLVQDAKLDIFVQEYTKEGIAVMTFDYATFGWSEGWPRHQVIPRQHVNDWKAALEHVRTRLQNKVDTQRIAVWGISLSGGHVLRLAATDPDIIAVVSIVPHIKSGLEGVIGTIRNDPLPALIGLAKVGAALLKWVMIELLGVFLPEYGEAYVPLHGSPGSAAVMQNPGDDEGFSRLVQNLPESLQWKNRASVASILPLLSNRPFNVVDQISCSTLHMAASLDTLCPAEAVEAATNRMDRNKTRHIILEGASHFDVYEGQFLQRVLQETRSFLVKKVPNSEYTIM